MTLETVNHIGDLSIVDPPSTDSVFEGDDHIRNIKRALQADMPVEHQVTGANAGAHKFKMGSTAARPAAGVAGRIYWNTDELTVQRDDGSAWQNIHTLPRYAQDSSVTPNQITVAFSPASPAITLNQVLYIRVANTNTGAVNIAVDGFSNVALKKIVGGAVVDLDSGDILATQIIEVKHNPAGTPFFQLLSFTANALAQAQITKLLALKPRLKDWGSLVVNTAIDLSLGDLHVISVGANLTLTFSSSFTQDKAVVAIKNQSSYAVTVVGIDNLSPTITVGTNVQDFLGLVKSFGKITLVGNVTNQSAV